MKVRSVNVCVTQRMGDSRQVSLSLSVIFSSSVL